MIREVDLISYLPPFMKNYKEIIAALEAERPEFNLIWSQIDRCLRNRFISTADEYGISRFEKMLNIYPNSEDTLEIRRKKVQVRWLNTVPYTMRSLKDSLSKLYGKNFSVSDNFDEGYTLTITLYFLPDHENIEIKDILERMIPQNIIWKIIYENPLEGKIFVGGNLNTADITTIRQVM